MMLRGRCSNLSRSAPPRDLSLSRDVPGNLNENKKGKLLANIEANVISIFTIRNCAVPVEINLTDNVKKKEEEKGQNKQKSNAPAHIKFLESIGFSSISGIFLLIAMGFTLSTFCTTALPYTLSALVALTQRHWVRFTILRMT